MNAGEIAKLILPPVISHAARKLRSSPSRVFENYQDALRHCGNGYSADDLVSCIVRKTEIWRDQIGNGHPLQYSAMRTIAAIGLSLSGRRELSVVDFGGGAGFHYFIAKKAFPDIRFQWTVVETKEMATAAISLATDELSFSDSLDTTPDLLISSGSLQYTPDPEAFLAELLALQAEYVFLTRTMLSNDAPFTEVQTSRLSDNGPGPLPEGYRDHVIQYPVSYMAKQRADALMADSYEDRLSLIEDADPVIRGNRSAAMYGYHLRKRY